MVISVGGKENDDFIVQNNVFKIKPYSPVPLLVCSVMFTTHASPDSSVVVVVMCVCVCACVCVCCLLYTSPSPRDRTTSRMPSSA